MKVLLIEDDLTLGESLKEFLELEGFTVKWIYDDREIEYIYDFGQFDVIVLDLILKFSKGEDILRRIRQKEVETPVLILTAKTSIYDKEVCFNLGADDYLTKPFEIKELILRLKALARRKHKNVEVVKIGNLEIYPEQNKILKNGKEIKLSKTAWNLLKLLIKNRGEIVPTERILNYVWDDKPVTPDVVRAYIKELRKILPPDSIKTYKGIGYKLE